MADIITNLKIGQKVALNSAVILIFLIATASIATISLSSADTNFMQYRSYALQTNQLGRIQANLLTARLNAKEFIISNTDDAAEKVRQRKKTTSQLIDDSHGMFTREDVKKTIAYAQEQMEVYQSSFEKVTELVKKRNKLVRAMDTLGPKTERDLTQIMESAFKDDDAHASHTAGTALRSLLLARFYASHFLDGNTQADVKRVNKELADLDRIAQEMRAELENPTRRKLADAVILNAKEYKTIFNQTVDTINTRNDIIHGKLDKIGPELAAKIEYLKLENKKLQDELGPKAAHDVHSALIKTEVISVAAIVLSIILSFLVGRAISRPIVNMTKTMGELASGNLNVEISALGNKDEIGDMASAVAVFKENALNVNKMTATQKQQEEQIKHDQKQIMLNLANDFDSQIGGLIDSLSHSSQNMNSTAQDMKQISQEASDASSTVAHASKESHMNVSTVAAAMEEMVATSQEIASQINMATTKSNDTARNAQSANETVSTLNERVENIGEVVIAIQDIAEQTNLLALNATIEAARAGEAGKGFAVVADEVKKLATETAQKTSEINSRISDIQSATSDTVTAMGRIISNISEIDEAVTGVSAAVEEQNATSAEINRSITEASTGAQQVSDTIINVQRNAEETGLSADSVLTAASEVTTLSTTIKTSVDSFLANIRKNDSAA